MGRSFSVSLIRCEPTLPFDFLEMHEYHGGLKLKRLYVMQCSIIPIIIQMGSRLKTDGLLPDLAPDLSTLFVLKFKYRTSISKIIFVKHLVRFMTSYLMTKLNDACSICIWLWFYNEWFEHKMTNALSANCYDPLFNQISSKHFGWPFMSLFDLRNTFHFFMTRRFFRSFKMKVWVCFLGKSQLSQMSQCVSLWQYIKVVWQMIFRLSFVCN